MTEKWNITIRFVDRDMVMRFYWGLGVGHVYSHEEAKLDGGSEDQIMESEDEEDEEDDVGMLELMPSEVPEAREVDEDLEDFAEEAGLLEENLGMDNGDDEDWEDSEDDLEEDSGDQGDEGVSGYADMDSTS